MLSERFIDLRSPDHEQVSRQRFIKRQHRLNIAEHNQRLLRLDIRIATEHDVESILQRLPNGEPRLPSHHHRMSTRRLPKKLHVRRVMPRQLPTLPYRAFPIDCCNPDDHDVYLYTATGAAILPCDW